MKVTLESKLRARTSGAPDQPAAQGALRPNIGNAPAYAHDSDLAVNMRSKKCSHVAHSKIINRKFRGKLPSKSTPAVNLDTLLPTHASATHKTAERIQRPSHPPTQRLEVYTLALTKCPPCQALFALQQDDN